MGCKVIVSCTDYKVTRSLYYRLLYFLGLQVTVIPGITGDRLYGITSDEIQVPGVTGDGMEEYLCNSIFWFTIVLQKTEVGTV